MQPILIKLRGATGRLAATYLIIIMAMTLIFSGIIYGISSSQFDRPFSPRPQNGGMMQFDEFTRGSLQDLLDERAQQARAELLLSLFFLNLAVLLGGVVISYILARKTLAPIEAAIESQAQFVSDASHELRTPLTALQVTNEVALRKKKLSLAQAKELIGYNLAETIKLRSLSESLLGLAKQDNADTSEEPINMNDLVADVLKTFTALSEDKKMSIRNQVSSEAISANQFAVTQIVRVFIDNAIKYGPDGSHITLSSTKAGGEFQLSVHNDGPGIPVRHQSNIFKRFYRVDESRSSQNMVGSGLGLSIAKAAADRQGYRVSLKSGEHEGSTFTLHIPTP